MPRRPYKGRILLVDDDDDFRSGVATVLAGDAYEVFQARSGNEAQALLSTKSFTAIISDIRMPDGDGITFLKWAKKIQNIPFVVITGYGKVMEKAEAEYLGVAATFIKPFSPQDLLAVLENVLERSSA